MHTFQSIFFLMDEISTDISIKFIFLDVVGPVAQQT